MSEPPPGPPSASPPPVPAPSASWAPPSAYPSPYGPPVRTSGLAVASLVTGIVVCFVLTPIAAVITGYLALEQIADSNGTVKGRGMAIAGIVLGWVWIGITGLGVLAWVITLLAA